MNNGNSVNSGRALKEVLNFSKTIEYQAEGFLSPAGEIIAIIAVLFILLGIVLAGFRQLSGLILIFFCIVFMAGLSFNHISSEASHNNDLKEVKQLEWEREYAQPYFRELPLTKIDDFESFAYDYELEKEKENEASDWDIQERKPSEKPVILKMKNGSNVLLWAEVIYDPKVKADYMEYKYLTAELRFDEHSPVYKEKGFQDVKIYTNKP